MRQLLFIVLSITLLLSTSPPCASAEDVLGCEYRVNSNHDGLEESAQCLRYDNGRLTMFKEPLGRMSFTVSFSDERGLASIAVRDLSGKFLGYAYVKKSGEALLVPTYDNSPEPFKNGLVRVISNGKIGYADRNFKMVIEAKYDGGLAFGRLGGSGYALVCNGCGLVPVGEYMILDGGLWGYIDVRGNEILPLVCAREEAQSKLREFSGKVKK